MSWEHPIDAFVIKNLVKDLFLKVIYLSTSFDHMEVAKVPLMVPQLKLHSYCIATA